MSPEQFERLIAAVEANTQAQTKLAEAVADMADQSAALIELVASGQDADEDSPAVDLAGNPIRPT